jgi:hypothetical protein
MLADMWHQRGLIDCCGSIISVGENALSESLCDLSGLSVHVRTSCNIMVHPHQCHDIIIPHFEVLPPTSKFVINSSICELNSCSSGNVKLAGCYEQGHETSTSIKFQEFHEYPWNC